MIKDNTAARLAKFVPFDLKREVRKAFNTKDHAAAYEKLETFLGEEFCVYEDGTVYAVAKLIAGVY
jgi:hypothetical protein